MRSRSNNQINIVATGTYMHRGKSRRCEVFKFCNKLKIIDCKANRTISTKSYDDMTQLRKDYPGVF